MACSQLWGNSFFTLICLLIKTQLVCYELLYVIVTLLLYFDKFINVHNAFYKPCTECGGGFVTKLLSVSGPKSSLLANIITINHIALCRDPSTPHLDG